MAAALNDTYMEEGVPRPISQHDEAKALVWVVPLDGGFNGGPGGAVKLWTARRRVSEIARRRLIIIVGEITATGRAKISVSVAHVSVSGERDFNIPTAAGDRQRIPTGHYPTLRRKLSPLLPAFTRNSLGLRSLDRLM